MFRFHRVGATQIAIALTIGLSLSDAFAQQSRSLEWGIDAGLTGVVSGRGNDVALVTVPVPRLRAGWFVTDALQIEPSLAVAYRWERRADEIPGLPPYYGGTGEHYDEREYQASVRVDLLLHAGKTGSLRPFVKVGGGASFFDFGSAAQQAAVGGGVGIKVPVRQAWGARVELGAGYRFETDKARDEWDLSLLFGVSFFTL